MGTPRQLPVAQAQTVAGADEGVRSHLRDVDSQADEKSEYAKVGGEWMLNEATRKQREILSKQMILSNFSRLNTAILRAFDVVSDDVRCKSAHMDG